MYYLLYIIIYYVILHYIHYIIYVKSYDYIIVYYISSTYGDVEGLAFAPSWPPDTSSGDQVNVWWAGNQEPQSGEWITTSRQDIAWFPTFRYVVIAGSLLLEDLNMTYSSKLSCRARILRRLGSGWSLHSQKKPNPSNLCGCDDSSRWCLLIWGLSFYSSWITSQLNWTDFRCGCLPGEH